MHELALKSWVKALWEFQSVTQAAEKWGADIPLPLRGLYEEVLLLNLEDYTSERSDDLLS